MQDHELVEIIQKATILSISDRQFLVDTMDRLSILEKFKFKTAILDEDLKTLSTSLKLLHLKFPAAPVIKKEDEGILGKISSFFKPKVTPKLLSPSSLSNNVLMSGVQPQPLDIRSITPLVSPLQLTFAEQIALLPTDTFANINTTQLESTLQTFLERIDIVFEKVNSLECRRDCFATFMQSPLFRAYMTTAMTAIDQVEIEPRESVLDILARTNQNYLNKAQFETTSSLISHLRHVCSV